MPFSEADLQAMERRLRKNRNEPEPEPPPSKGVADELKLHNDIIAFCNAQWPQWVYIHANPVKKSCIQLGAPDFPIIYMPGGKFLIVECKKRDGKLDDDQQIFKKRLEMLGHTVHIVRSMEDFQKLL